MGIVPRGLALLIIVAFLIATAIGSTLPELGNLVATRFSIWAHSFNVFFLILGIIGLGMALYLGYRCSG